LGQLLPGSDPEPPPPTAYAWVTGENTAESFSYSCDLKAPSPWPGQPLS